MKTVQVSDIRMFTNNLTCEVKEGRIKALPISAKLIEGKVIEGRSSLTTLRKGKCFIPQILLLKESSCPDAAEMRKCR
jgi:hypothetical protein